MPPLPLPRSTKITALVVSMGLIIVVVSLFYSKTIPKASVTIYRFSALKSEIIHFSRKNDKPPDSLSELTLHAFDRSILTDAWNQPITYNVDTNFQVTLRSYGPRHGKGGREMMGVFPLRIGGSLWVQEDTDWITNTWQFPHQ